MKKLILLFLLTACGGKPEAVVVDYFGLPKVEYNITCKKATCGGSASIQITDEYAPGYIAGSCTWHCANWNGEPKEVIMTVWTTQINGEVCLSEQVEFSIHECFSQEM